MEAVTAEHEDDMIKLALMDIKECMPDLPVSEAKMRSLIKAVRLDAVRDKYNIWLGYQGADCVAFAIGMMEHTFYSDVPSSRLTTIYIHPEHRNGFVLLRMLKKYEAWARDNGSELSFCGVERENVQEAAVVTSVFPRLGYKWAGSNFTRRL